MSRYDNFEKKGKCSHGHCSKMSNSAWTDLNSNNTILKLHDVCPRCKCQKQITFTPNQYQLEGGSIKSKLKKIFKGTEKAWNKFLKPALNATAPFIGMAVASKTKNPKIGKATSNILKSISGGRVLTLTDQYTGSGLRLKVM